MKTRLLRGACAAVLCSALPSPLLSATAFAGPLTNPAKPVTLDRPQVVQKEAMDEDEARDPPTVFVQRGRPGDGRAVDVVPDVHGVAGAHASAASPALSAGGCARTAAASAILDPATTTGPAAPPVTTPSIYKRRRC